MYHFYISKIFAESNGKVEKITPKKINVIIGPNNSGKSKFIKELCKCIQGGTEVGDIVKGIDFALPRTSEAFIKRYNIEKRIQKRRDNDNYILNAFSNRRTNQWNVDMSYEMYFQCESPQLPKEWRNELDNCIKNGGDQEKDAFLMYFGDLIHQYLGTEDKLTICKTQRNYGIDDYNTNLLSANKFNDVEIAEMAKYTKKLFRKDIILDDKTLGSRVCFRVDDDFSKIRNAQWGDKDSSYLLSGAGILDDEGDGFKSFVSTYLSLISNECDVLLLDEPESSLHPPLSRQLGEIIGEVANSDKQLFVATHSVDILKGILSSCSDVNIIRITRPNEENNIIKEIPKENIDNILINPLLRVSRVMEGLFCDKVIITESEADELVYQELIHKTFGNTNLYFAHAQGMHTIPEIAEMYNSIGVKYVMITDFDVLNDKDAFKKCVNVLDIDEKDKDIFKKLRSDLHQEIEKHENNPEDIKKIYHEKGLYYDKYSDKLKSDIESMMVKLRENNFYILPTGELETVLEKFGIQYSSKKNNWIVEAIECIEKLDEDEIRNHKIIYEFLNGITN